MKQLFIQLNAVILLLLVFSFHCQGADKYTLEYKLEKGKTYKQHSVSNMSMTMNAMGQDIKMDMQMSVDVNFAVIDQTNDGYNIQMSYRKIKTSMTSPTEYSVDSDSPENSSDKSSADFLKSLIGVPIDVQLTQQGKVTSVKGVDKLVEKINTVDNPQLKQMFNQQFSEKMIQKMIEQFSIYFPDKPVAVNDAWDVTTSVNANGFDIINKMTLTLKQVANNVADIDLTGTLTTPEGGVDTKIQGMDAKITMTGNQTGTVQLDMKTGWLIRSEVSQKSVQNIEIMGQTMPQQVDVKITTTAE